MWAKFRYTLYDFALTENFYFAEFHLWNINIVNSFRKRLMVLIMQLMQFSFSYEVSRYIGVAIKSDARY